MLKFSIDFGINSPCLCFRQNDTFEYYFFTNLKKHIGFSARIKGKVKLLDIETPIYIFSSFVYPEYTTREERFDKVSTLFVDKINSIIMSKNGGNKNVSISLEGYAYGISNSRSMSGLYEIGGLIRNKLYHSGLQYKEISPTSLKKVFTGRGNSNKVAMSIMFEKLTGINLFEVFGVKQGNIVQKPLEDIIDATALSLYDEMKLIPVKELKKQKVKITDPLIRRLQEASKPTKEPPNDVTNDR